MKVMFVLGTRPEAIKLAPVVHEAQRRSELECCVVRTSQHKEMLDQVLADFDLTADLDLDIMKPDQDLAHVATEGLRKLHATMAERKPDWVIVQGDTTTTFVGALAAFYNRARVVHVEAGLRTYDKHQPFPEEVNRCLTTQLADLHCAPTAGSRDNLLREGVSDARIVVTGNTAIDALLYTVSRAGLSARDTTRAAPRLLLTAHRRENHGEPMERICDAVLQLLERYPALEVHYPVHLSPRVRQTVFARLGDHPRVSLTDPLGYRDFVLAMHGAHLILTDSGGVQEEAPSLGKPVLVMRESTERPEAVQAGTSRIVGTDPARIVAEAARLLDDAAHYDSMARAQNPYGDGKAAARIVDAMLRAH